MQGRHYCPPLSINMSNTIETIFSRRSVREFTDEKVDPEIVDLLLGSAIHAPSGLNNQPWRFIVIRDPDTAKALSGCTHYTDIVLNAGVLIAVYLDNESIYHREKDIMAIGAAIENMLLACVELDLGAVWLGEILKEDSRVNEILQTPDTFDLMAVVAIGYPLEKQRTSTRKDVGEVTFYEKYGLTEQ